MHVNDLVGFAPAQFLFSDISVVAGSGDEIPHLLFQQVGLRVLRVHNCAVSRLEQWQVFLSQVSHLRELSIRSCNIQRLDFLTNQPNLSCLTVLDLSGNPFNTDVLAPLVKKMRLLERLSLSGVGLIGKQDACRDFFIELGHNRTITFLDISSNKLGKKGSLRLTTLLESNPNLKHLEWDDTHIKKETVKERIRELLVQNNSDKAPDDISEIEKIILKGDCEDLETFVTRDLGHHKCQDSQGNGIFHFIARHDKELLVRSAVNAAYPISRVNERNETALHIAARMGLSSLIEKLFDHGIKCVLGLEDCEGNTALIVAGRAGYLGVVEKLVREGADINHQNCYGNTLLHELIVHNQMACVAQIFDEMTFVIDFYRYNVQGMSPLHLAASLANLEAINLFYQQHIDMDILDKQGNTALHIALFHYMLFFQLNEKIQDDQSVPEKEKEFRETIAGLIHYGADLHLKNASGVSALEMVRNCPSIRDLLQGLIPVERAQKYIPPVIRNLFFAGCAVRGTGYYGVLKRGTKKKEPLFKLEDLQRVGGTSAGAITACLVSMGYKPDQIKTLMDHLEYRELLDGAGNTRDYYFAIKKRGGLSYLTEFILNNPIGISLQSWSAAADCGYCKGEVLHKKFCEWIAARSGDNDRDLTFLELHQKALASNFQEFKDLYVTGMNATTQRIQVFSYEETPHVVIADAVRISMSIPIAFVPHSPHVKNTVGKRVLAKGDSYLSQERIKSMPKTAQHYFVDGGLTHNFSPTLFDHLGFIDGNSHQGRPWDTPRIFNRQTLAFSIVSKPVKRELAQKVQPEESPKSWVGRFLSALALSFYNREISDQRYTPEHMRTVYIDDCGVDTLEFNLTDQDVKNLIRSGKRAVEKFREGMKLGPGTYYMKPELIALFAKYSAECFVVQDGRGFEIKITQLKTRCAELIYEVYRIGTAEEKKMLKEKLHLNLLNTDQEGNNAIHIAVSKGDLPTLINLIEAQKYPYLDAVNHAGKTPLDLVFTLSSHERAKDILGKLLEKGARKCCHLREDDPRSIRAQLEENLQQPRLEDYLLPLNSPLLNLLLEHSEEFAMKKTEKGYRLEKIRVLPSMELALGITTQSPIDFKLIGFLNLSLADIKDENGRSVLYSLCLRGKVNNVKKLLKHVTFDPETKDNDGKFLLDSVIETREKDDNDLSLLDKILIILARKRFPCSAENKQKIVSRVENYVSKQKHLIDEQKQTDISKSLEPYREPERV